MNEDLKEVIRQSISPVEKQSERNYDEDKEIEIIQFIGDQLIGGFIIDDNNLPAIKAMIAYFNSSATKGILLRGGIGAGKSILMKIFQKYTGLITRLNGFKMVHVRDVILAYNTEGYKGLNQFMLPEIVENGTITKRAIRLCVDDIGTEENSYKFFGSQVNLIEELIYGRYDIWTSRGVVLHIATNLTPQKMKEMYGDRAYSRLVEMMNDIVLSGNDRRR